jgi:hypothetical protein
LDRFACYSRDYHGSGAERPRWANYEDFKEDVDDIGDGGFKDEIIGHREGFWQPRNQRDFMYFDEVLWQKKRRIQKERWYLCVTLLSNLIYLAFQELVSLHVGCMTT